MWKELVVVVKVVVEAAGRILPRACRLQLGRPSLYNCQSRSRASLRRTSTLAQIRRPGPGKSCMSRALHQDSAEAAAVPGAEVLAAVGMVEAAMGAAKAAAMGMGADSVVAEAEVI